MQEIKFEDMVNQLAKEGDAIVNSLNGNKAHLLHMVVGIAGEAGELLDAIKKHVMYEKKLDIENVIEELGDLEFYMEGLRQGINEVMPQGERALTREETLAANIRKLGKRYKGHKYSDQQAQDRADKQEPVTVPGVKTFLGERLHNGIIMPRMEENCPLDKLSTGLTVDLGCEGCKHYMGTQLNYDNPDLFDIRCNHE